MQIVLSALKGIYGKQRSRLIKEAISLGRHTKHNLIMSNWLECSLEGTYYKLIPSHKFLLLKQLLLNYLINSSHFTKIDGSLPRPQQPNLGYPQSDESSDLHKIGSWSSFWYHSPFTTRPSKLSLHFRLVPTIFCVHFVHHIPLTRTRPLYQPSKKLVL
jgi:hypothetical protein